MQIVNKEAQLREHEGFLLAAKLSQMSPAFLQNSWATMEESILQNICCLCWWKLETISCCFLASTCSHQQRRSRLTVSISYKYQWMKYSLKKRWPPWPQPARLAGFIWVPQSEYYCTFCVTGDKQSKGNKGIHGCDVVRYYQATNTPNASGLRKGKKKSTWRWFLGIGSV